MNGLTRFSKIAFVIIFSLFSVQNLFIGSIVEHAYAGDCTVPGPAAKLGIYTTDRADFLQPTPSLDPQAIVVGQQSVRMEVEIEDVNGCPVTTNPLTTRVTLSISNHAGDLLSVGGVNQGESYNFTIAKTNSRGGFFVTGKTVAAATLTAITRVDSDIQLTSGTQTINVTAPAPVFSQLVFTNNAHGTPDSIAGSIGAVPAAASVPGIVVRAYSDLALTTQLGSDSAVLANGSFPVISTGDDQYRTVYVVAVYPAIVPVLSDPIAVAQTYPALVTGLTVVRGLTDRPQLSWVATEPGVTFRVYRALANSGVPLNESDFIGATSVQWFTDNSVSFVTGSTYRYAVKQVSALGSYTPEFLPTTAIRLDLSGVVFTPAGSATNQTTPTVSFTVTSALRTIWNATPLAINVVYTNTVTGAVYTATVQVANDLTNQMVAGAPYIDSLGASLVSLPDGSYSAYVKAQDVASGISDVVTNAVTYSIDTILPQAPVLSLLRFSPSTLSGIASAVESGVSVDVYTAPDLNVASKVGTALSVQDGSFSLSPLSIPVGGVFYLVARDAAGNGSPATAFDVVSTPLAPVTSRITMEQNAPGIADRIIGTAGAVTPNMTVRIYGADPALTPNLAPLYEFVAQPDGSFVQNVGDNAANAFWVTVWSGNSLQSPALQLINATFVSAPSAFRATAGDNTVTLQWDKVSNASYYTIEVYNITAKQNVQKGTLSPNQTSVQLTLQNGSSYRFYIHAVDAYGNVSAPREVESTPHAPQVVLVSATTTTPEPPVVRHVTAAPQVHKEVAPPEAPSTPVVPQSTNRDWTTWFIVGLGLVLLALAAFFGWQLWFNQPTETVVTTSVTKKSTTKKEPETAKKNDSSKPRW